MASTQVIRVTMFKFPKKENQEAMAENYREMMKTAVKVYYIFYSIQLLSRPHLLSCLPQGLALC